MHPFRKLYSVENKMKKKGVGQKTANPLVTQ